MKQQHTPAITLITVSGDDKPGVTSSLMTVLTHYGAIVLDIGQAVIHDTLSLGILAQIDDPAKTDALFKDLLFRGHELGLSIKFRTVEEADYERWVGQQTKSRYIITLLGARLLADHLAKVAALVARHGLNIDTITRLTGRVSLEDPDALPYACVEFAVSGPACDAQTLRSDFLGMTQELDVDIAFQIDNAYRRNRRLVAFDMDSTLIQTEVIDELADAAGVRDEVAAVTESAMRGEIPFQESLRRRLALLQGLEESRLADIADSLPFTRGAERLVATLKGLGFKTAIVSGGFTYFGRQLQKKLGVDYVCANELEIHDAKLTGHVIGDIVDGERKAAFLKEIAAKEGIHLEQIVAVGDGANDLPMLNLAGLGIAFHAKPLVKESADHALSTVGLDGVLYLIGVRDREALHYVEQGSA